MGQTSDGQVSEEEPAGDEGLLGVTWGPVHDVQVGGVEAQGGGGQTVRHQVHPQQLDGDQGLGEAQRGGQEDAVARGQGFRSAAVQVSERSAHNALKSTGFNHPC